MNNLTFSTYISTRELTRELDEGFFDSMKQGFQSKYASASTSSVPDSQDYEKYASKALPAIQKAAGVAKKYADKLGIPLPLATSIVAAGLVGGPAAVPYAAMLYFVRKPINNIAGKAFDAGVSKFGDRPVQSQLVGEPPVLPPQQQFQQSQPQQSQPSRLILPGSRDWNGGRVGNLQRSWTSFEDYKDSRDLQEGIFGDTAKKVGDWWKNKGADKVGGALGAAAGYTAGKGKRYSGSIASSVKSSYGDLSKFASENKLPIARAAFLMAVGAALGSGIGMATNALSGVDDLASQAMDGLRGSGTVSAQDVESVGQSVGIANQSVTSGDAAGFLPPNNKFWGSHIGEPVPGLQEPGIDTSGQMPKGRFYGDAGTSGGHVNDDGTITQTPIPQHAQDVQNQIDTLRQKRSH